LSFRDPCHQRCVCARRDQNEIYLPPKEPEVTISVCRVAAQALHLKIDTWVGIGQVWHNSGKRIPQLGHESLVHETHSPTQTPITCSPNAFLNSDTKCLFTRHRGSRCSPQGPKSLVPHLQFHARYAALKRNCSPDFVCRTPRWSSFVSTTDKGATQCFGDTHTETLNDQ
jgi:hypothetical protein